MSLQTQSRTMAGGRRALGKGISALIPTNAPARPGFFSCPIDRIRPMHDQPRRDFDDEKLAELAQSIEASGVLQPVVVRRSGGDYTLIAGERRWRAAQIAGLTELPVVVKDDLTDAQAYALALVENLQREDLSALETAQACQRLIDEHGFTQDALASAIGKSRSAVANTLRLLKLSEASQISLAAGQISEGHARQLVGLEDEVQVALIAEIAEHGLSVRQTENRVRAIKNPAPIPTLLHAERAETALEPEVATPNQGVSQSTVPYANRDSTDAPTDAGARSTSRAAAGSNTGTGPKDAVRPQHASQNDISAKAELLAAQNALRSVFQTHTRIVDRGGKGHIELHFDSYEVLEGLLDELLG